MAMIAEDLRVGSPRDERFFLTSAIVMTVLVVAGFSNQFLMGRSTFAAPLYVHAHAVVFMGWVAIYLAQNVLAGTGRIALHRRLGWLAAAWMVPMLVLGCMVTAALVRRGQTPFFFLPGQFIILNPLSLVTFIALALAAIRLRWRTDWHRRLHLCGMSLMMGPALDRIAPIPFLIPWAWEATVATCLLFPLAGVVADIRRDGRVHPAWGVGLAVLAVYTLATEALTYSPLGDAIYRAVTAGSPGAAVAPLEYPPPPPGFPKLFDAR